MGGLGFLLRPAGTWRGRSRATGHRGRALGGFCHRPPGGPDRARHPGAHQCRRSSRAHICCGCRACAARQAAAATHQADTAPTRVGVEELAPSAQPTHVVQPGETLWSIADSRSGDGADWTSIAALNLGTEMPEGARFVDPDHIRAGWRFRLPPGSRRTPHDLPGDAKQGNDHLPELVALGLGSIVCAAAGEASPTSEGDETTLRWSMATGL